MVPAGFADVHWFHGGKMKRIVIGEFKSMRSIGRLLDRLEWEFGVFVDFNTLEMTPFDWTKVEEIIVYLEDIETFTRHHDLIGAHRDRIWILPARRRLRKYRIALENEGYRIIDSLGEKPLPQTEDRISANAAFPRCLVLVGDFEPVYRFAVMASGILPCLLVDLDGDHALAERRIALPVGEVWHFLSEHLKMHGSAPFTHVDGCKIVPVAQGDMADGAEIKAAVEWIHGQRQHGLTVVRLDPHQWELGRRLAREVDEVVVLSALRYEELIRADRWLQRAGGGRILGIRTTRTDAGFITAQSWVAHEILGVIDGSRHPGKKHVNPRLPRKRTKDFRRMLAAFGLSRRGS